MRAWGPGPNHAIMVGVEEDDDVASWTLASTSYRERGMCRYGEMPLQLWSLDSFLQLNRQTRLSITSIEQVAVIARVRSTGRRDFCLRRWPTWRCQRKREQPL